MLKTFINSEMTNELTGTVAIESYLEEQAMSDVIAIESFSGFLNNVASSFASNTIDLTDTRTRQEDGIFYKLFIKKLDSAFKDAVKHERKVFTKLPELEQTDLGRIVFVVPDRLSGNYNLLLDDLMLAYAGVIPLLKSTSELFKQDLSINIKLLNVGRFEAPKSIVTVKDLRVLRESYQGKISKFFTIPKSRTYSTAIEHFRSITEIRTAYDQLHNLESIYSDFRLSDVNKLADSITELVSVYIEELKTLDKTYIKKNRSITQMSEVIIEIAKSLEFIGYLQARVVQTYVSFTDLSDKIIKYK